MESEGDDEEEERADPIPMLPAVPKPLVKSLVTPISPITGTKRQLPIVANNIAKKQKIDNKQ